MTIQNDYDIAKLIMADPWMMKVLKTAEQLNLPDWWIGAGFLRNKVWDTLEGNESAPSKDVDLVYFNGKEVKPETDWAYDEQFNHDFPFANWEVRNQARMHYKSGFDPYTSTKDGIAHWTETATCIAVRLHQGTVELLFCHGMDDLLNLIVRPSPYMQGPALMKLFYDRIEQKGWRQRWPHLRVIADPAT